MTAYHLKCIRVPPVVRVPPVENLCSRINSRFPDNLVSVVPFTKQITRGEKRWKSSLSMLAVPRTILLDEKLFGTARVNGRYLPGNTGVEQGYNHYNRFTEERERGRERN
jgi:hypothetical protein